MLCYLQSLFFVFAVTAVAVEVVASHNIAVAPVFVYAALLVVSRERFSVAIASEE